MPQQHPVSPVYTTTPHTRHADAIVSFSGFRLHRLKSRIGANHFLPINPLSCTQMLQIKQRSQADPLTSAANLSFTPPWAPYAPQSRADSTVHIEHVQFRDKMNRLPKMPLVQLVNVTYVMDKDTSEVDYLQIQSLISMT